MFQEPETKLISQTLVERVNELVQAVEGPAGWGNALASTTPNTLAVADLAMRTQALEKAVLEIALEVQSLTNAS